MSSRSYVTWLLEKEDGSKAITTWYDWKYKRKEFFKLKKEEKLIEIEKLQPHQKKFEIDDKGVFRNLYNKNKYYVVFN